MPRIAYKNFTGGEVSPTLTGRYDLNRYANSVQRIENMLPGLHGDAARRPGTRFVADLGGYSVLIPFSFNVDADQNFVIVLSHKALRVSDGARTLSTSIATPYAATDLLRISAAQVGDIVYLAHPSYPLHKIMRTNAGGGGYFWSDKDKKKDVAELLAASMIDFGSQRVPIFGNALGDTVMGVLGFEEGGHKPGGIRTALDEPVVQLRKLTGRGGRAMWQGIKNADQAKNLVYGAADIVSFYARVPVSKLVRAGERGYDQWQRGQGTPFSILMPRPGK